MVDHEADKTLVYAEVEEGVISVALFFSAPGNSEVAFRFSSEELNKSIYELWHQWRGNLGNKEWRAMEYVIERENFNIDLTYPEKFKSNEEKLKRRQRVIEKHFNGMTVNYSAP